MLGGEADAQSFTQLLFNRLMFCWFLQKKGWLGESQDYLLRLFDRANGRNFYDEYLSFLFFKVLSDPEEERRERRPSDPYVNWEAPFLNGGLFERTEWDQRVEDSRHALPNSIFKTVLHDLFAKYNFAVEESTSLDVQVALDPELLGTIFERLVTGRHETGSYYTPRPIVEFMCRESLVRYLTDSLSANGESRSEGITDLVLNHEVERLSSADAIDIIRALDRIKVCDPACGSGAYLVGMLHELVDCYRALYSEKLKDPQKDYDLKLRIIERNLYGVDSDSFAVNIARLRLWLSLVVDNEETDWRKVKPLPNLDFKIEEGNSLTAPDPQSAGQQAIRDDLVRGYSSVKARYMVAHHPEEKAALHKEIESKRRDIAQWTHGRTTVQGFDWAVGFAEVFAEGGFDIVLANPPYIRQELLGRDYKEGALKPVFSEVYSGTADLYVYFYARAHQLLRPEGIGCFISSNKWLRAGYGEKLRQYLLDNQAVHLIVDFGELPVFQAATFPAIFLWQKRPRFLPSPAAGRGAGGEGLPTTWAVVKDLQACYDEGIREHIVRIAQAVPASQFGKGKSRLTASTTADRRATMESSGQQLGKLVEGQIKFGIKTGLNEAFIINQATRDRLIAEDSRSAEILKPLLVGDDVRRYELHFRETYLIWTYIGVPINRYPAVLAHLKQFQEKAEKRWDQGKHWWELRACDYYDAFDRPKIIYPDIGKETRFVMDTNGYYGSNTTYLIAREDWFILGVLNSAPAFEHLKGTCTALGDEEKGGRLRFFGQYLETFPIPDAPTADREAVAKLARQAQQLHTQRRQRVERFLNDLGLSPSQSNNRNPLEQPWAMTPEEFARRARQMGTPDPRLFTAVRDETTALTEQIARIEREIDARVGGLYGLQ